MRGNHVVQFIALFAITPTVVWGAELSANLGVGLRYESNLFRDANTGEPVSDYGVTVGPSINFRDTQENYNYNINYNLSFVRFKQQTAIDDVDHSMGTSFAYVVTPRLLVRGQDSFRLTNRQISGFDPDDPDTPLDESGNFDRRTRDLRNSAQLGLSYSMSQRLRANLDISHFYFRPEEIDQSVFQSIGLTGGLSYRWSRANSFGAGASMSFLIVDERPGFSAYRTDTFNIYGAYTQKFTEKTTLSLRGGPTWLRRIEDFSPSFRADEYPIRFDGSGNIVIPDATDSRCSMGTTVTVQKPPPLEVSVYERDNCQDMVVTTVDLNALTETELRYGTFQDPPSTFETLTFFVTASLRHRWTDHLNSSASYRRSQEDRQELGGSTIRDRVSISTGWRVSPQWSFAFRATWTQRTVLNPQTSSALPVQDICDPAIEPSGCLAGFSGPVIRLTGQLVTRVLSEQVTERQSWSVSLNTTRRLSRRFFVEARYQWVLSQSLSLGTSHDNHRLDISLSYRFDPIRLLN